MANTDLFIVHPRSPEQASVIKAFLSALKIDFERTTLDSYNPEFVSKIEQSRKDYSENKGRVVQIDELEQLWK